ncbi:MAG TPA: acyltransferase, partial [Flavisolibacter sp.]|nr:acyltransferase [Flavisolibacter sp.]
MFAVAEKRSEEPLKSSAVAQHDKIPWVYHARGIAIMLIVYRHVVLGMTFSDVHVSPLMYDLQMVFFNFRMPAFFILSGVFIRKSLNNKTEKIVARNKVYTLLYPYILWSFLTVLLQICFSHFSNARRTWVDFEYILIQPRALDQLWYLIALFNTSILFLVLYRFLKNKPLMHILIAIGLHYLALYIYSYSFFSDFCNFYIYFLTGALLSDKLLNINSRNKILNPSFLKWVFPLFLIGQWFWFENNTETLTRKDTLQAIRPGYETVFLFINYIGCFVLFICSLLLAKAKRYEWLAYIGRNSLYIYILHVQIAAVMRKIVRDMYPNI